MNTGCVGFVMSQFQSMCTDTHGFFQCCRIRGKAHQQRSISVFSGRIILGNGQGELILVVTAWDNPICAVLWFGVTGRTQVILFVKCNFPVLLQVCHLAFILHSPQKSQWEFKAGDRISLHLSVHSVLWNTQQATMCTSSDLLLIKHVPEGHTQPDVTKSQKCLEFSWVLSGICVNCECELWCFQGQGKELFFCVEDPFLRLFLN